MLKKLFWLILGVLFLAIVSIWLIFSNETVLNTTLKTALQKSLPDLHYRQMRGTIWSGIEMEGIDYAGKFKADAKLKVDFGALKSGILKIEDINLSHLQIDPDYLKQLIDANSSDETKSDTQLPIKELIVDRGHLDLSDLRYGEYRLEHINLDIADLKSDLHKHHTGKITLNAQSNVADLKARLHLKGETFALNLDATPKVAFIQPYLKDSNLSLTQIPKISLKSEGDLESIHYDLHLLKMQLQQNGMKFSADDLHLKGIYQVTPKIFTGDFDGGVDTPYGQLQLEAGANGNINDLNQTLRYRLKTDFDADTQALNALTKEQNLTILTLAPLQIDATGDMKTLDANVTLSSGDLRYGKHRLHPKIKSRTIHYTIPTQWLKIDTPLDLGSDMGDLTTQNRIRLKLDDLNQTLKYQSQINLKIKKGAFASLADEQNISIDRLSPLRIALDGDARRLDANATLKGAFRVGDIQADLQLKESRVHFDLLKQDLQNRIDFQIKSNKGDATIKSDLALNLKDINRTLRLNADADITHAKRIGDLDLGALGDLHLHTQGQQNQIDATLKSPKISAKVTSSDLNRFNFSFDTKRLYLEKIYAKLPADLNGSFTAVTGEGSYTLEKQALELSAKLKAFSYQNRLIHTNRFKLYKEKDRLTLTPLVIQSGKFKLQTQVTQEGDKMHITLKNRAFNAQAQVGTNPLWVEAKGRISSIKRLISQIDAIYPIGETPAIDGSVDFGVHTQGERISARVRSPKITLPQGRLEQLKIDAIYQPHKVIFKRFSFWQKGFGKKMDRQVRLRREGVIAFDEENATIDLDWINLGRFYAKKRGDVTEAKLDVEKLYLAYPHYGHTRLTSHLQIFASGKQKAITGSVTFADTEVNYESRFLDVSQDSDIIIVNGKKNENDDFIQNTFLDIKIDSKDEILYKVQAGEIKLKPDIEVRKGFGDTPRITGKIKILGGEYDLADKRFKLKEGAVAFRGLKEVNPLLDLHVVYDDIDEIEIFIDIFGDKNRPRLKFSSKPPRSKKDIFSYLLFGMSASETEGAMSSANKAAERIFGRAVSKDLARELKLDRLDILRNEEGGFDVKAGKKVGKKTIIYYQNKSTQSSVIVEHKLNKNWDVSVEAGKEGEAVDFVYRKGFK